MNIIYFTLLAYPFSNGGGFRIQNGGFRLFSFIGLLLSP